MFEQWASFLSNNVHTSPLLTSTQAADKDIISEVGLVVSLFMYKPGMASGHYAQQGKQAAQPITSARSTDIAYKTYDWQRNINKVLI